MGLRARQMHLGPCVAGKIPGYQKIGLMPRHGMERFQSRKFPVFQDFADRAVPYNPALRRKVRGSCNLMEPADEH